MLKKNLALDFITPSNLTDINITVPKVNTDELSHLINRLSESFKNYISQVKLSISRSKEILAFISKNTNYAKSIINNIINHNYSFQQLNSLDESINQIKEKNKNSNLNLFNYEQNLNIFLEETHILFKSIKQKYQLKLEEWSNNYLSIPISTKHKNNSIKKPSINNKSDFNEYNDNKIYNKINNVNENEYVKKRKKSTEIKNELMEDKRSRNMSGYNSQKIYHKMINRTSRISRNQNELNEKGINLINLNIPMNMNKSQSIYNIDIKNEVLLNEYIKNDPNSQQRNYKSHNNNRIINDEKNLSYEKKIRNLNKEIIIYKNIINSLIKNKNNININNNISNNDYKLLLEKLKLKENEILSKDKKIKLMNQEIIKYKNIYNNINAEKISSEIGIVINPIKKIKSYRHLNEYQRYKTEPNLSNSLNFNNNYISNNDLNKIMENNQHNESLNINYIKKIKYLEKENKIIKMKLNKLKIELSQKSIFSEKENISLKKEILELKNQVTNEVNKNEDLNKINQEQKIKYESEISKINDKRTELSKFLSNKNSEIVNLQNEMMIKVKELENYRLLLNKKESKTKINDDEKEKIKQYYNNILKEKETKELELNSEINILNEQNDMLTRQIEKRKKEINELNNNIKELELELSQKNKEINNINKEKKQISNINNKKIKDSKELELTIKKLIDENDGLKQFTLKQQKILVENEKKDEKISILEKEKEALKLYFINMDMPIPDSQISDFNQRSTKAKKNKTFESKFTEEECFNILMQLNEAKKEISSLKKKNEELFNDLDSKKLKHDDCFNHLSIDKPLSNYEEEFDLKKMAKGVKEKNRSQDINIDYPGIQQIKEKYRELDFYYNSLEDLVKKMLLCSTCTNKNKTYIIELCKIVGFDDDITNKIVNNKVKKGILNIFG